MNSSLNYLSAKGLRIPGVSLHHRDHARDLESSTSGLDNYNGTVNAQPDASGQPGIKERPAAGPRLLSSLTLPKNDPLAMFRSHLGIHILSDLNSTDVRPAANLGIYQRVVQAEKDAGLQYKVFSFLINGALGLQIIFAAALTALGAGNGPKSAVTAFGALNTVLAGFLTFLKGSGLPNRLKFYENEWCKVREYIEQRERDFAVHDRQLLPLNFAEEIATIERMYENVRKDIEANTPDSYISLSSHMGGRGTEPPPSLARRFQDYTEKGRSQIHDLEAAARSRFDDTRHATEQGLKNTQEQARSRFDTAQRDLEKRFMDTEHAGEQNLRNTQQRVVSQFDTAQRDLAKRFMDTEHAGEQNLRNTQQQLHSQLDSSAHDIERRFINTEHAAEQSIRNTQQQAQARIQESQAQAEHRIAETQRQAQARIQETQDQAALRFAETQQQAQLRIRDTQNQAEARFIETQQQATSKAQEIEEKVLSAVEKGAEQILKFTKHRHEGGAGAGAGAGDGS